MTPLMELPFGPTGQHLALALLHTLWQGLIVVALLWLLLRRISANRAEARYAAALASLLTLLLCGLVTWAVLNLDWSRLAGPSAESAVAAATERATADSGTKTDSRRSGEAVVASSEPAVHDSLAAASRQASLLLALVLVFWLVGVAIMICRMVCTVVGLRRFRNAPPVGDDRMLQWVDELRQRLRVRSLRVVETAEAFGPAVLGVLRPTLVLPLSMMTGLGPDAVQAILAHELAHVRRHDYLFNLVQIVIEAVLFFNPAVWWINRQIRIEREACCDAMAARVLGEPLVVAESLSLWAERVALRSSTAMAFADGGRGLLLDRILRIVLPGYRPQTPLSPLGMLGLFLGGLIILGVFSSGTSALVELTAKALTPAERMERIVETQKEYAPPDVASPEGKGTLSGTIRTWDEKPVTNVKTDTFLRYGHNAYFVHHGIQSTPHFRITDGAGKVWLYFTGEGYAVAIVGPFNVKAGEAISGIEVVLEAGFPLTVTVVDEKGESVEGATIRAYPVLDEGRVGQLAQECKTDTRGMAVLQHALERTYDVSVQRPGFQPLSLNKQAVKPDVPLTLTLVHARPLHGVILTSDGRPVADAEVREYARFVTGGGSISFSGGAVIAVTDAQGRFVLDELADDATYALVVVSKEHGRCVVQDVTAANKDLRIEMGPELMISGTIHGDLDKLTQKNGKPVITYSQTVSLLPQHSEYSGGGESTVEPAAGGGVFTLRGLLPSEVTITAADQMVRTAVGPSLPHQHLTIDLTKPATKPTMRQVVMRFITPDGTVPAEGTVRVTSLRSADAEAGHQQTIRLEQGTARFEAYVPGPLSYEPNGLLGYWFEPDHIARIESGEGPLEISVPVVPAGAIAGQVLNVDGTPAIENISIMVSGEYVSPQCTRSGSFGQQNINVDAEGKFFISPLPLGGAYTITARRGHTVALSGPLKIDAARPMTTRTLQFPPTTGVGGTVLDPDGRPMPNFAFGLTYSPPTGRDDSSWGGGLATDKDGRFRMTDLGVGVGSYSLTLEPRRDFCSVRVPLPLDGKPVTVQLKRGLTLEGQVLDDATGWPIPGVEIKAMPTPFSEGEMICCAETPTDQQGCFRFSNLEDRRYQIWDAAGAIVKTPDDDRIRRPGTEPLILRVTLPSWSKLQPRKPDK